MITPYISYIIFGATMALGYWFNRSSIFFIALFILLSQVMLNHFESYNLYPFISLLIPLNILLFYLLKDRGIVNFWGKLSFVVIGLQLFSLWVIFEDNFPTVIDFVQRDLLPISFSGLTLLPQLSLVVFLLALLLLVITQIIKRDFLNLVTLGVLVTAFLALHFNDRQNVSTLFYVLGGLMLMLAIVKASYTMAYMDELTKIPGRRAFHEELKKTSGKFVVALVDIDHFKKFNDQYGHQVGDEVLKLVASLVQEVNGGGKAFRLGGEEFVILFSGKKSKDVEAHLEELRIKIAQTKLPGIKKSKSKEKITNITVSIGLAEKSPVYKNAEAVIMAADKALYQAKKKGRNCLCK